jgi:hypothetical protein
VFNEVDTVYLLFTVDGVVAVEWLGETVLAKSFKLVDLFTKFLVVDVLSVPFWYLVEFK